MALRIPSDKVAAYQFLSVDLRLRDGTVIEEVAVDSSGTILGKVVGGQTGIDDRAIAAKQASGVRFVE
jgi:hypothetical protein